MTPSGHRYLKEVELREEGGTPAIVGSIRAGLVVQLKEAVGSEEIAARERMTVERVFATWRDIPEVCQYQEKVKFFHTCLFSCS